MNAFGIRRTISSGYIQAIMAALIGLSPAALLAQTETPVKPPVKLPVALPKAPAAVPKPPAAAPNPQTAPVKPPATATPRPAATPTNTPPTPGHPTPARPATIPPRTTPVPNIDRPRPGETTTHTPNGGITRGPRGDVREVHVRDMVIHHGPGGSRTIVRERPGHVMLVSNRRGYGYIQRPYAYRGATFVQRTYYVNGVSYRRFYRPYTIGGVPMNVYAPGMYYGPGFYGWAYAPWGAPVAYSWGWAGSPWYGYYGGYFTPYPVYASPSLWLTDYTLAQTLQADYQERAAELANAQATSAPLTPGVKQQVADEVSRQITLEYNEAGAGAQPPPDPNSSGIGRMLSDNTAHVFLVSTDLSVQSNAGECSITEGDVLRLSPGAHPDSSTASLIVLASKGQDCQRGATVVLGVADLQDMQNHMRETIDQGLAELQKGQGQNGLPALPAGANAPPVQPAYAAIAPPPDPNVATELSQQSKEGNQAEEEALRPPTGTGAAAPVASSRTLTLGQTPDEVIALLGQPQSTIDLEDQRVFVYTLTNLKVTFTNGKVSAYK
jgi:hypothetical protein